MKKRYAVFTFIIFCLPLLLLTACKQDENTKNEQTNPQETETNQKDNQTDIEDKKDKNNVEVTEVIAPDDQGDVDVWFDGQIEINGKQVIATGKTNLLPGSRLGLVLDSEGVHLIGTSDFGNVTEDGEFALETKLPNSFNGDILHININFKPHEQDETIKQQYMDKLAGDYVRIYSDASESYDIAAFETTILLEENNHTIPITPPQWEKPEDLGSPEVRMEPEVIAGEEFMKVELKSNIVDNARIHVRADIPDYISFGFDGISQINPDGTATIYYKNPLSNSKLKNVTEYDLILTLDPHDSNNGSHVREAYGKNGDKLTGDLTKKEESIDGDYFIARKTLRVKVNQ